MIVTIRERQMLGDYKCIDKTVKFRAISYYKPAGTSLYYFKINQFEIKSVAIEDIISIEE